MTRCDIFWQLAGSFGIPNTRVYCSSPSWESKHPCAAPVQWGSQHLITPVCIPAWGSRTPVCSPGWGPKRTNPQLGIQTPGHTQTPVCSPDWGSKRLGVPKHLSVAPFQLPWSLRSIVQVARPSTKGVAATKGGLKRKLDWHRLKRLEALTLAR